MKKISKGIIMLLSCCLLLAGCNKVEEPDQMAQMLYHFYIQEDMTDIDKLGLTQEEAESLIDSGVKNFEGELEGSLKSIGEGHKVDIKNEEVKKAIETRRALEKKLTVQAQVISKEKNTAQVEVKTTYFDEAAIYETASKALEDKMADVIMEDEDAFVQKCLDVYIEEIIKAYETAPISTDEKSVVEEFTKQDGRWLPVQSQGFIDELTEITSGYEAKTE